MAGERQCEQCGTLFEPRREHARFCSARCRIAWNREHTSGPHSPDAALGWSLTAMRDSAGRLARVSAAAWPQALAVISETVWWVTIVDATVVRYYPDAYDRALAGQSPAGREITEKTFAGLRFVRNQMGAHADPAGFVQPGHGTEARPDIPVAEWTWKHVPGPAAGPAPPRGRGWEISRHRAYQAQLAGHSIGQTIARAVTFLTQVSAGEAVTGQPGALPPLRVPAGDG